MRNSENNKLRENQYGFREKISFIDLMFASRTIKEEKNEKGIGLLRVENQITD